MPELNPGPLETWEGIGPSGFKGLLSGPGFGSSGFGGSGFEGSDFGCSGFGGSAFGA